MARYVAWFLMAWALAGVAFAAYARAGTRGSPTAPPAEAGSAAMQPLTLEASSPIVSAVVLVRDEREFIEALGTWTPARRFPVLIDDGSYGAAQDAARFVRAFQPAKVVRWKAAKPAGEGAKAEAPGEAGDRLDADLRAALCRAWGVPDERALHDAWRATANLPAGMVVYDPKDPAYTGALALAAGHGQLLVRFDKPGGDKSGDKGEGQSAWPGPDGALTLAQAMTLVKPTSELFQRWLPEGARSKSMRAITLCMNIPVRVQLGGGETLPGAGVLTCKPGEPVALSDLIGRFPRAEGASVTPSRWGVGGQVLGTASRAAYQAMCSLFLAPRSALVFDGYNAGKGFDDYDGTEAGRALKAGEFEVEVHDRPGNTPVQWSKATRAGLRADLVLLNSHGQRDVFNLADQPVPCGDVPVLSVPAVVSMVHSWSAVSPLSRWTVGGRWIERGAYAYVGAVHEPYLAAFVPTPKVAQALATGVPLGLAIRMDMPAWRVAMLGDPLLVVKKGTPGRQAPGAWLTPERGEDVDERMKAALRGRELASGGRDLIILGRDRDAARLGAALARERPAGFTPEAAALLAGACFREGELDTLFALLPLAQPALDPQWERGPVDLIDMAWHAAAQLGSRLGDERIDLLIPLVRPGGGDQALRDARALAGYARAGKGEEGARRVLQKIADTTTVAGLADQVRAELRK